MAVVNVSPSPEYLQGNPYVAKVGSDSDFEHGQIRIEPPFTGSEAYFNLLSSDVDVQLRSLVTTEQATLLDFVVVEDTEWKKDRTPEQRVKYTVQGLLNQLGQTASANLFENEWSEKA